MCDLAWVFYKTNQYEKAIHFLQRVHSIEPDNLLIVYDLIQTCLMSQRHKYDYKVDVILLPLVTQVNKLCIVAVNKLLYTEVEKQKILISTAISVHHDCLSSLPIMNLLHNLVEQNLSECYILYSKYDPYNGIKWLKNATKILENPGKMVYESSEYAAARHYHLATSNLQLGKYDKALSNFAMVCEYANYVDIYVQLSYAY